MYHFLSLKQCSELGCGGMKSGRLLMLILVGTRGFGRSSRLTVENLTPILFSLDFKVILYDLQKLRGNNFISPKKEYRLAYFSK